MLKALVSLQTRQEVGLVWLIKEEEKENFPKEKLV